MKTTESNFYFCVLVEWHEKVFISKRSIPFCIFLCIFKSKYDNFLRCTCCVIMSQNQKENYRMHISTLYVSNQCTGVFWWIVTKLISTVYGCFFFDKWKLFMIMENAQIVSYNSQG